MTAADWDAFTGDSSLVSQLYTEAAARGIDVAAYNVACVSDLLTVCPDVDLLATALTMSPRPAWVADVAALHPPA